MKTLIPGHVYQADTFDGPRDALPQTLSFMQRFGPEYPGNEFRSSGTNCQEILRVLIDRVQYLHAQEHSTENHDILYSLRQALWYFELRAARRHGRTFIHPLAGIENQPTCKTCGHIGCEGKHKRP